MPAKTKKQQRFMGAELRRKREGKATRTGMTLKQLREMATKPRKKAKAKAKGRRKPVSGGLRG